jgi:hypothetical protein
MRLFSRGSEAEEGAIGQEVTGTSKYSEGCLGDEARPQRDFVRATTEGPKRSRRQLRLFRRQVKYALGGLLIGRLEVPMTMTYPSSTASSDVASYGGFVDAVGGIATVVLAIIGLAGVKPDIMVSIATVVFGAALLIQGGAMLTEFALIDAPESGAPATGGGISALFLVGFGGIVLGILALLGVFAPVLTSVSAIAFGAALVISSTAVWQLLTSRSIEARFQARSPMLRVMASEVAAGSAGLQAMAGLAVIVLGILAVAGVFTANLTLIAFLVAGAAIVLTGSTLSGTMMGFMRPSGVTASPRVSERAL